MNNCQLELCDYLALDISKLVITYLQPTQSLVTLHGHSQLLLYDGTYRTGIMYSDTRCISFKDYLLLSNDTYHVNDEVLFTHYHVHQYDQNVEIRLHRVVHNTEPEFEQIKEYMKGMTSIGGYNLIDDILELEFKETIL